MISSAIRGYVWKVIRRSKNIRDRLYPREQLPGAVFAREVLRLASTDSVLVEVGCGREATWLRSVSHAFKMCYGIDPEADSGHGEGVIVMRGDGGAIPLPSAVADVVTMVNVTEHLSDPQAVLTECARILRPGAHLVLLAPNVWFPPICVGRLLPHRIRQSINRIITATDVVDTFPAFYRANTERSLVRMGARAGLIPAKTEYLSNHPQYFMFSTLLYRCMVALERGILRRPQFRQFRHYILISFQREAMMPTDRQRET